MLARSVLLALALLCVSWFVRQPAPPAPELASPLTNTPRSVGAWVAHDVPLDPVTLRALGVDDYLNRRYERDDVEAAPIDVYVAYYASQRQGDAIHSPLNCLPGTGWQPIERERARVGGNPGFTANRLVVQKGKQRQAVLYWYEGRGRRVANEYMNKLLLILDGMRVNRTEAALVRLSTPVNGGDDRAGERLASFAAAIDPVLARALAPAEGASR